MPTLLLKWLFYKPVGHLVEALQHAHGYHRANPEFELHLFLNVAVELAEALPWVTRIHSLDVDELAVQGAAAPCLHGVPSRFDYVISDPRPAPAPSSRRGTKLR